MTKPVIVIKLGGNDFSAPDFIPSLAAAVRELQQAYACVLVHGGGRTIDRMMARLDVQPKYADGQRVTDEAALEIAEMVLSGQVNKTLVLALLDAGCDATGLSGVDRGLIRVEPWSPQLGRVGRVVSVRSEVLESLLAENVVPVISPISAGPGGKYNVNADVAAGAVAGALGAEKIFFISNVPGVLLSQGLAPLLTSLDVRDHISSGVINGGMVPKVSAALEALSRGARSAVITDLAGLQSGSGTIIHQSEGAAV